MALPRTLVNRLLDHARRGGTREVCGLIAGRQGKAAGWYPVRNIAARPERRYRMDPREQIRALRTMRERGEELLAIYHSHPAGPAAPSAIDIAEAGYPEAIQLIISLSIRGVLELRGYRIRDGGATEVALEIQP